MTDTVQHHGARPPNDASPREDQDSPKLAVTIWRVWPWASWLLPLAVVFVPAMSPRGGGWYALMLLLLSPVIVAAAGLLGSLPRFLLRRAGYHAVPVELMWLLVLHWWSWVPIIVTFRDATDMGRVPSLLNTMLPVGLSHASENVFRTLGFIILVLTWIVIVMRVLSDSSFDRRAHWVTVARVTGIVTPVLLVLGIVLAAVASAFQQDAAGDRPTEVADRSSDEQRDRYESRHIELQETVVPLREAMSPEGWDVSGSRQHTAAESSATGFDTYSVELRYSIDIPLDDAVLEQFAGVLEDSGWEPSSPQVSPYTVYEHREGAELHFRTGDELTSFRVISPTWWGEADIFREPLEDDPELRTLEDIEEGEDEQAEEDALYDFDEWPEAP